MVAALFSGRLGDKFGLARVIFFASFVYGTGFLVGGLAQEWHSWYLGLIGVVAIAGGTVMTLAWGLLLQDRAGGASGRRLGARDDDEGDRPAVRRPARRAGDRRCEAVPRRDQRLPDPWPFCGLGILGAIPLLVRLMAVEDERARAPVPATPPPSVP